MCGRASNNTGNAAAKKVMNREERNGNLVQVTRPRPWPSNVLTLVISFHQKYGKNSVILV